MNIKVTITTGELDDLGITSNELAEHIIDSIDMRALEMPGYNVQIELVSEDFKPC